MLRRQFLAGSGLAFGGLAACQQTLRTSGPATEAARAVVPGAVEMTRQDLEDALTGSGYLSTGGGGSLAEARDLIASDLDAGLRFYRLSVDDLGDDDIVGCPYGLGSLAPEDDALRAALAAIDPPLDNPTLASFRLLEAHMGRPFAGVIMGEIGPLSLAEGLSIAARLGIPALDADTVGRAVPEINQHSVRVAGVPLTPTACVTAFGDDLILKAVRDPDRAEVIFRTLSVASGVVGVTDSPISGKVAKGGGVLVRDTLSLSMAIGRAVREAKAGTADPIEAARAVGDGYRLFEGRIEDFKWGDADGFLVGDMAIAGDGLFAGQTLTLDYKNEYLVATRDGEVIATCPDLICLIDRETADAIINPDFERGQRVAVLGYRCDPIWRTKAGLAVFSPRYFGYDIDYRPIEARLA
ncbi:MAG: DUF917 domain-containing protein [Pseudomonadota bacterium]